MLLDKPLHYARSPEQRARNSEALRLCLAGELRRGDLPRIVLGGPAAQPVRDRSLCVDCGGDLLAAGPQLAQQGNRCRPCGQERRRKHNQQQSPRASSAVASSAG